MNFLSSLNQHFTCGLHVQLKPLPEQLQFLSINAGIGALTPNVCTIICLLITKNYNTVNDVYIFSKDVT